jgi:hypothetical protein
MKRATKSSLHFNGNKERLHAGRRGRKGAERPTASTLRKEHQEVAISLA